MWVLTTDNDEKRWILLVDKSVSTPEQDPEVRTHKSLFNHFLRGVMKKQSHEYRTRQMLLLIQPLQFHSSPKGDKDQLQAASLMSALVPTHQDTQVHV